MFEQNQIAQILSSAEATVRLKELLSQAGSANRTEIGRRACQLFGFQGARGRPQLAGCLKALRTLDARDRIELPAPRHDVRQCQPRPLGRLGPSAGGGAAESVCVSVGGHIISPSWGHIITAGKRGELSDCL